MLKLVNDNMRHSPNTVIQDIGLLLDTTLKSRYILKKYISIGQTSLIYLAYDTEDRKEVLVKEFCPYSFANRDLDRKTVICKSDKYKRQLRQMHLSFQRECEILKRLMALNEEDRKHIVPYLDSFDENKSSYLVMEYIQGNDLAHEMQAGQNLNYKKTIRQIIKMVAAIHKMGILHLDLKPSNILINENKELILIDFGSARYIGQNHQDVSFATFGYSAPELFLNTQASRETDIYSLGAMIYYFTTGYIPQSANERLEQDEMKAISAYTEIPALLEHFVMKCLKLKESERLHSLKLLYCLFL